MSHRRVRSILVIQKQRALTSNPQTTLQELGYDAFASAETSEQGLAEASKRCPDLVLLDVRIKGRYDWLETATTLTKTFGVPVVFLGKRADRGMVESLTNGGGHNFVCRPIKLHELRAAIEITLYRHEVEKQLQSQDRWFVSALQSISDAVIDVDQGGKITFMSTLAEQLTGVSPKAGVGRTVRELIAQHEWPLVHPYNSSSGAESAEGSSENFNDPVAESQDVNPVPERAAPALDQDQLHGPVMVFSDIAQRKREAAALDIPDRVTSLGTITAGVAHEINNPLAVVLANASVGREELAAILSELRPDTTPSPSTLQALRGLFDMQGETMIAADRIARIIGDLKVFGRDESPSPSSKVERAVKWALRTTAHELSERARVVTEIDDVTDVRIDEGRLTQVLVNLLVNAAQAIPRGHQQTKEVRVSARQLEDDTVVLEVADTGGGMSAGVLAQAFDPFFTTQVANPGAGLGLPICQGIVRSVGGTITAESIVGVGSKFTIVLPAVQAPAAAEGEPSTNAFQNRRILVIDDDPLMLRVIRRVLKGYEIVCVETGAAALHMLRQGQPFELILCDLVMPQMNGAQLYDALIHSQPTEARKLVFLNGGADNERLAAFLASIPNYSLGKPFKAKQLRAVIERALSDATRPSSVPPQESTLRPIAVTLPTLSATLTQRQSGQR